MICIQNSRRPPWVVFNESHTMLFSDVTFSMMISSRWGFQSKRFCRGQSWAFALRMGMWRSIAGLSPCSRMVNASRILCRSRRRWRARSFDLRFGCGVEKTYYLGIWGEGWSAYTTASIVIARESVVTVECLLRSLRHSFWSSRFSRLREGQQVLSCVLEKEFVFAVRFTCALEGSFSAVSKPTWK